MINFIVIGTKFVCCIVPVVGPGQVNGAGGSWASSGAAAASQAGSGSWASSGASAYASSSANSKSPST